MPKFTLTASDICKELGISNTMLYLHRISGKLKEGKHYKKISTKFYLYSQSAIEKIKRGKK